MKIQSCFTNLILMLCILLTLTSQTARATDNYKPGKKQIEAAKKFTEQPLIVLIVPIGQVQRGDIHKVYNTHIEKLVRENWTLHPVSSIQFKSPADLKATLSKEDMNVSWICLIVDEKICAGVAAGTSLKKSPQLKGSFNMYDLRLDRAPSPFHHSIYLDAPIICRSFFPVYTGNNHVATLPKLSEGELKLSLNHLQNIIGTFAKGEPLISDITAAKEKTLLIAKEQTQEINLSAIQKVYPYKVEIVSRTVIEKAILDKDPRYVCLLTSYHHADYTGKLPQGHPQYKSQMVASTDYFYEFIVFDLERGKMIASTGVEGKRFWGPPQVSKRVFKVLADDIEEDKDDQQKEEDKEEDKNR